MIPGDFARLFLDVYEDLAPDFSHSARRLPVPAISGKGGTRRQTVPWDQVPPANKVFLTELAGRLLNALLPEATPVGRDGMPAQILIRTLHEHTTGLMTGDCADIVEALLVALTDGGYLIVSRADTRLAWSWAVEALSELPAEHLPAQPYLQYAEDTLDRLHALLTYTCPDRRDADDATRDD